MTRWGIIGAGGIARVFANGVRFSKTGTLAAVASLTAGKGESLAADFAIPRRHARYEDLLDDPGVDAVYISVIHPLHAKWTEAAAKAGKHILVEKPMGMNAGEATRMIDAARRHDVFLMEAYMYRTHPQVARLAALIRDGAIGDVLAIRSTFSFSFPFDGDHRLYNKAAGGGAILDVGGYPASFARFVAGAAQGKPFADPVRVNASGIVGRTGVDTFSTATMEFPGGIMATLTCGISCEMPVEAEVFGTNGRLSLPNPWLPSTPARTATRPLPKDTAWPSEKILLWRADAHEPTEIVVTAEKDLYSYEADEAAEHFSDRQAPAMSWDDSLGNMRLLDRWLGEVNRVAP